MRKAACSIVLAIAMVGCGAAPETYIDLVVGSRLQEGDRVRTSASLRTEGEEELLEIVVADLGPEGVADVGRTRRIQLALAPGALEAGAVRTIEGHAVLSDPDAPLRGPRSTYDVTFSPGIAHDPAVLDVSAAAECFCAYPTLSEQDAVGELRVISVTDATVRIALALDIDGTFPGDGASDYRLDAVVDLAR